MLALSLFAAFLVIRGAPDSLAGRALRRTLVDWPAARLARVTRGQLGCVVAVAAMIGAALWFLEGDGLRIMSFAAPETMAWFATFEISTLADVLVAVALVSAHARLRSAGDGVRAALGSARRRIGSRSRAPRRRG